MADPQHVVVVGAGPGGLASAMLLARAGLKLTVLEKRDRVGGRTSAIHAPLPAEHGGGPGTRPFTFDLGPTFFLYPRILEELYAMCGLDLHDHAAGGHGVELTRLDPQYRLLFEGDDRKVETVVDCTADPERMAEQIAKLSPADAAQFPRFLDENRAKFAAFTKVLQRPWKGLTDYLDPQLAAMLPLVRPHTTVDTDLGRYFQDPRVRLAFSFQAKYLGMSPFNCPSLFTILSYLEYDFGVFHPTGGCNAVSTAMAGAAEALGAEVELDASVTGVDFEPGTRRATGVTYEDADGIERHLDADAVVIGADFAHAMANLVPDRLRKRWKDKKLEKKKYSCSTYMLYLGVEGGPEQFDHLEHHNIFLTREYRKNLDEIENGHRLSDEPSVYLHHPGHTDPTMAPEGFTSLYVLAPTTHQHGNVDWQEQGPGFRDTVYRQLAKMGLEDLKSRVVFEKPLTPDGWAEDLSIFKGATFNLAHNLGQMLHLRPNNRFEDLDGVYLVGGGTHPGSGLPVIYEGARISAKLICDDLGVEPGWDGIEPKTATPSHDALAALA